jgi:outer membrane protein TolC
MKKLLLLIPVLLAFAVHAQKKVLTLGDVITLARTQSPSALLAKNKFNNNYWEYRIFRTSTLPTLSLDATLPNYLRSIRKITLPNGADSFTESSFSNYDATLSISKRLGLTGGSIFLSSGLQQLTIFQPYADTSFLTTPISIGFTQPLFAYNPYKWQNKIEPLKYKMAKQQYLEDMEDVSAKAAGIFFDLLLAQANLKLAEISKVTYDSLYMITKGRYGIGKIAENELLEMELNKLNAEQGVAQAQLDLQVKTFQLKSFLGIKDATEIELVSDFNTINFFTVDLQKAQAFALQNRPSVIQQQVQLIQAQSELVRSKRENRFSVNVFGSYGLTQSGPTLTESYQDPLDQQQVRIGLQIPIIDWGKAHAQIKMALSNQELVKTTVEQNRADFEQEIFLKVTQFNMQKQQLTIAAKADTIAQKSFEIAKYRFLIGKIDIESLTLAQRAKESAHNAFYAALRSYWESYFEIRRITLFDFEKNAPIDASFEDLVK